MSTSFASTLEALQASTFQRLHPRAYYERFLAENVRPDGRELSAWRDISVNVGAPGISFPLGPAQRRLYTGSVSTANGSALVRLGNTTIVCGVKAEIAEPELDIPDQGFLGACCPSSFALADTNQYPILISPPYVPQNSSQDRRQRKPKFFQIA